MLQRRRYALGLVICCAAGFAAVCRGQDPAVGDLVVTTAEARLKVETSVVATAPPGAQLTVQKVQDKWLWVEDAAGVRGWVDRSLVQVKPSAAPAPNAPSPATPAAAATNTGTAPAAAATPAATPAAKVDDPWLVAIGVLAGQNIYVTYAYIGSVADGYARNYYDAAQVQELMKETISLTDVAIEHLDGVQKTKIVDADKQAIARVAEVMGLLKQEAQALSDYAQSQSQDEEALEAYEAARTAAWPKIKQALRLP
jgi:NACalpha-BTF3-like transcription factor